MVDGEYIGVLDGLEMFEQFSIPAVPILGIGSFEEMLQIKNDSLTQIPFYHKMPLIPEERFKGMWGDPINMIEGAVIAPDTPAYFGSGSFVSLKSKNPRFTEKNKVKVAQAPVKLTDEQQVVYDDMLANVTENRLRNVLSKFGQVTQKDFGKLLGQMNGDVIQDHMLDNPGSGLEALEKKDRKLITKLINKNIADLIRPNFQNIIDGTF